MSGKRHLTTADLTSRKLNYKDLGGFIGLPPGDAAHTERTPEQRRAEEQRVASGRVLPNRPFNLTHLRDHDVDVRFKGTNVKWEAIPLDQVVTHIVLKDGVMRLEPLDFGIADGHVVSNITLDATHDVPTAQAKIEARNVELKRIFPQLASPNGSAAASAAARNFVRRRQRRRDVRFGRRRCCCRNARRQTSTPGWC